MIGSGGQSTKRKVTILVNTKGSKVKKKKKKLNFSLSILQPYIMHLNDRISGLDSSSNHNIPLQNSGKIQESFIKLYLCCI